MIEQRIDISIDEIVEESGRVVAVHETSMLVLKLEVEAVGVPPQGFGVTVEVIVQQHFVRITNMSWWRLVDGPESPFTSVHACEIQFGNSRRKALIARKNTYLIRPCKRAGSCNIGSQVRD